MANASLISRLSRAVDQLEELRKLDRPWKVVSIHRAPQEDGEMAKARHFAAHPEDRDADVIIWKFFGKG